MSNTDLLTQYNQLEAHLNALLGEVKFDPTINLRLERIERLLHLLANPDHAFRSIHVGGTSGKGSTAALIAAGCHNLGYTTGLHTSPHLQVLNESALINGQMAPTTMLLHLFESKMQPAIEQMRHEQTHGENGHGPPSHFEVLVALSFLTFAEAGVDVAVVEVGLGGRLDATNVLPAEVAVLTNVSLDHTAILGDTVAKITREKVGIFKPNQRVILGTDDPTVYAIAAARCAEVGATLQVVKALGDQAADDFRAINLATATAALSAFEGERIVDNLWHEATQIALPARTEIVAAVPVPTPVPIVLDGAHNPAKMRAADHFLCQHFADRPRVVVAAMKLGKAADEVLAIMLQQARVLIASQFLDGGLWQSIAAEELAHIAVEVAPHVEVLIDPDPLAAVARAYEIVYKDEVIWITGSLYFAGEVRDYWFPKAEILREAETASQTVRRLGS